MAALSDRYRTCSVRRIIEMVEMAANNNSTTALSEDGESFLVPEEVQVSAAIILGLWVFG